MKIERVVYPGTFDPITYGHLNLIQRAVDLFGHVLIAIAEEGSTKQPLFTVAERVALAQRVTAHWPTVKVIAFRGLLIDFLAQQQSTVLIRGLRSMADFDYEFRLAQINRGQMSSLETLFLIPAQEWLFISSSLVKEMAYHKGKVEQWVPAEVAQALAAKFHRD